MKEIDRFHKFLDEKLEAGVVFEPFSDDDAVHLSGKLNRLFAPHGVIFEPTVTIGRAAQAFENCPQCGARRIVGTKKK